MLFSITVDSKRSIAVNLANNYVFNSAWCTENLDRLKYNSGPMQAAR